MSLDLKHTHFMFVEPLIVVSAYYRKCTFVWNNLQVADDGYIFGPGTGRRFLCHFTNASNTIEYWYEKQGKVMK